MNASLVSYLSLMTVCCYWSERIYSYYRWRHMVASLVSYLSLMTVRCYSSERIN